MYIRFNETNGRGGEGTVSAPRRCGSMRKQSQASVFSSSRLSRRLEGDGPDSHD